MATLKAHAEELIAKAIAGEATVIEQNGRRAVLLPCEGDAPDFELDGDTNRLLRERLQAPGTSTDRGGLGGFKTRRTPGMNLIVKSPVWDDLRTIGLRIAKIDPSSVRSGMEMNVRNLHRLGLSPAEAVNMLLAQIELRKGLPFEVSMGPRPLLSADEQAAAWTEAFGAY